MKYRYTLITAIKPGILSKSFRLEGDKLIKSHGGVFIKGNARKREETLQEFVNTLKTLDCHQALCYGWPRIEGDFASITLRELKGSSQTDGTVIAHIKEDFQYEAAPGLLFGDVDFSQYNKVLTVEEIQDRLYDVIPALRDQIPHVISHSASSWIYNTETGELVRGEAGKHFYFAVKNGREIPAIGERLFDLLWLKGFGYNYLKSNGVWEPRALLDRKVWYQSCYDFAGGAWCDDPLEQRRPDPILINPNGEPLSLDMLPQANKTRVALLIQADQEDREPQRAAKEAEWLSKREQEQEDEHDKRGEQFTDEKRLQFREHLKQICEDQTLSLDDIVHSKLRGKVTVREVLDQTEEFHETLFRDPADPEYNNGEFVAKGYLKGKFPFIHSFAHGSPTRFYLLEKPEEKKAETPAAIDLRHARDDLAGIMAQRDKLQEQLERAKTQGDKREERKTEKDLGTLDSKILKANHRIEKLEIKAQHSTRLQTDNPVIQIRDGSLDADTNRICEILREEATLYERGNRIVKVNGGEINLVTHTWLRKCLSGKITFECSGRYINCPKLYAETVCAMAGEWRLAPLKAVITQPTISRDGRIIDRPGYDQETGLYFHFKERFPWEQIPDNPSDAEVRLATEQVMAPIKLYPFIGAADRATAVAGFLSAVIRPWLFTCPGFTFDSPTKGSGKTKLANCIRYIAPGRTKFLGPVGNDEEMAKQLLGLQLEGCSAVVFDEMTFLGFKTLNGFITNNTFGGRILKSNDMPDFPTNMLLLFTGINLNVRDDSNRRFLRCRIDPKVEDPTKLRFAFDPVRYTLEHRWEIIRATLLLHRAAIARSISKPAPFQSFEEWSDMVRPVITLMREIGGVELADPCETIDNSLEDDPEYLKTKAFIHAVMARFYGRRWSVHELVKDAQTDDSLKSALLEVGAKTGFIDATKVGKWLSRKKDTITGGFLIRKPEKDRFKDGKPAWEIVDTKAERPVSLPANVIQFPESQPIMPAEIPPGTCSKGTFGVDVDLFNECDNCSQYDACAKAFSVKP